MAVGLGLLLAVAQDMSWGGRASERSYPRVGDHEEASRKVVCSSHVVGDDDYDADDIDIRPSVGNKEDFSPATIPP